MRRTKWGGLADRGFEASGFFRVDQRDGIHWLVDPDGGLFLSKGVNNVRFDPDNIRNTDKVPYAQACLDKYGSRNNWRAAAANRLVSWNFNTIGCWSDEVVAGAGDTPLAMTPIVDLGASFWLHRRQRFPDVFDDEFESHIRQRAKELCTPRRNAPQLLGTFIDNELYWSPDWRGNDELLTTFLNFPPRRPGRETAITALQQHYRDFEQFNAVWCTPARSWDALHMLGRIEAPFTRLAPGARYNTEESWANKLDRRREAFAADCDAFAAVVADRYFELCVGAIKAADPNHLVLGARFGALPHDGVLAAAARHLDVISFNCYHADPTPLIEAYATTGKPCIITEFSFRGDDVGLPNSMGGGPRVPTQTERAACFRSYATAAVSHPNIVGYHWFEHADQPREGRFDGEDCNYGTVTIEDQVYPELTGAMTEVNADAELLHSQGAAIASAAAQA